MSLTGGCSCRAIRYELTADPLIVHACHCLDCQRRTGGPHVINLWIETAHVVRTGAEPRVFSTIGDSGKAHDAYFCPDCGTDLWSRYHSVPGDCRFVRAGTLDDPAQVAPDIHIFTRSKLPWVRLPDGVRAVETGYKRDEVWAPDKLARLRANAAR
jgi:hypothetical protein